MSTITSSNQQINKFLQHRRDIDLPFVLSLTHAGETEATDYHCTEILNVLPKKRLVLKAFKDGVNVLIKFFPPSPKGERQHTKEITGHALVASVDIKAPQLISSYALPTDYYAVVYEWIEDAKPFSAPEFCINSHIISLYTMMATMHASGIYQRDAHLDNILVRGDQLYLIDFGSICLNTKNKPLSKKLSLKNLAKLVSNFPEPEQEKPIRLLASYYLLRSWEWGEQQSALFKKQINAAIKKRDREKRNETKPKVLQNLNKYFIRIIMLILASFISIFTLLET